MSAHMYVANNDIYELIVSQPNNIEDNDVYVVSPTQQDKVRIEVIPSLKGEKGDPGQDGIDGVDGADGAGVNVLNYQQTSPQDTWMIAHNFGRYPLVSVQMFSGEIVSCDINHLNINTTMISFNSVMSGIAILRG